VLYHYAIVRTDLPRGTLAAQLVHAAGESCEGLHLPSDTHAVVLGVPDERELLVLEKRLIEAQIPHRAIREPDPPWNGQLMAIGLVPGPREKFKKYLSRYPLLK